MTTLEIVLCVVLGTIVGAWIFETRTTDTHVRNLRGYIADLQRTLEKVHEEEREFKNEAKYYENRLKAERAERN